MNVGIVGCGAIANRWVRVLTADPRVTVTALVDPDRDRAAGLADRHGLRVATTTTLADALDAQCLDIAVNLTPPALHAAISRVALDAGLHVLTEKPLTTSLADAVALTELARNTGRVLAVMANRPHDPGFQTFRKRVCDFAGPLAVAAEVCVQLLDPGFRIEQPLPATTDLAVHAFDQIQTLTTAAPLVVTCHETALPFLGQHCSLTIITVRFADDSIFTYRGGYTRGGLATSAVGAWRVDAADGAAQWQAPGPANRVQPGQRRVDSPPGYQVCITGMIDALHQRQICIPSTANLRTIAMLEAALTSAGAGAPALVPSLPWERR